MMTGETGYALAAMVLFGLGDFVYKRAASAGVKAHHFLMGQAWFFSPLILIYSLVTKTLVLEKSALWGALAGLFIFIAFYNFMRSLATGSISIVAPIFRLNFIITAFLAVSFLDEPLTLNKFVGLVFALIAIWLLLGGLDQHGPLIGQVNRRSLTQVSIATIALGAANFFHKVGLDEGALPATLLVSQAAVFISIATTFTYVVDGKIQPSASMWKYSSAVAVLLIGAFLLLLRSLAQGEASVLVPIAQMGFIVTAALGMIFLQETLTIRKAMGLLAALAALAVLAAS